MAGSIQEAFRKTLNIRQENPPPQTVWDFFKKIVEETENKNKLLLLNSKFEAVGKEWYRRRFESDYVVGEQPDLRVVSLSFTKLVKEIAGFDLKEKVKLFSTLANMLRINEMPSDTEYPNWINEKYISRFDRKGAKRDGRSATVLSNASLNFVMAVGELSGIKDEEGYKELQSVVYSSFERKQRFGELKLQEVIPVVVSCIRVEEV